MKQEVGHRRGDCNSWHARKGSGEMTSMDQIDLEHCSQVARYSMLSGAQEWTVSMYGAPENIDSSGRILATRINHTLYGCKK
jgi:hypothetical protein